MKKIISLLIAVISAITLISNIAFASFPDVTSGSQIKAVDWLQANGVVQGYSDGTFGPLKSVTRAEFLKMLYETIGIKGSDINLPFSDIDQNAWYIKYLKEAYANHVIDGYSDGTFKPNNTINVVEAAKIVGNAFFNIDSIYNSTENPYRCSGTAMEYFFSYPENVSAWYAKYVSVIDSLCLTPSDGFMGGGFFPKNTMSRGAMAVMIYSAKASHDNGDVKYTDDLEPKSKISQEPSVQSEQNEASIEIKNFAFNKSKLTVKKGTKVTWTNNDSSAHTVTVDSGTGPSSGNLSTGDTYSYTFDTKGTFSYHCNIHTSMKGTVTVTE